MTKTLAAQAHVDLAAIVKRRTRPPRHRHGEMFLRGPIPLPWLTRAAALPGKALTVGLAIWFQAGLTGKAEVKLTQATLVHFNVGRKAAYRALDFLQAAGLIAANRANGRCPRVTLLDVHQNPAVAD
ncbi:MAG: hypothetical protein M5U26_13260 [Planctomycetota bacterium]|nr:hypothetical protein [Planctomycetota bacterium]